MPGSAGQKSKLRKVASKLCIRCNRVLPLGDFYPNKDWRDQAYRDCWCKACAAQHCYDADSLRQYCYENNRRWEESLYDSAMKKAQYSLATNAEYIDPKTSAKKRDSIAGKVAARQFFSMMNMKNFYHYVENVRSSDIGTEDQQSGDTDAESSNNNDGDQADQTRSTKMVYNKQWRGYFTEEQIDILEETYSRYEEDFVLDNVNICDYARKVAKASLNADIAEDKMRRGEISAGEYKEAQKIFDDLSKSSNFAACRRKPGESSGQGSLGEIVLRLEVNGDLNISGVTFPKDDIDLICENLYHTIAAAGASGQLS